MLHGPTPVWPDPGEIALPLLGPRLRAVLTSSPVIAVATVLLAVAVGIAAAWLHVLRPPPPPTAATAFIQMLSGDTNPF